MHKATLEEIKACEFKMLLIFDEFCREHRLKYYLAGGTLLGAVRHQGFIPWDDDIDVCMPRADYVRFVNAFKKTGHYELRSNLLGNFTGAFSKLVDTTTKIDNKYTNDDRSRNLWIDIFPVDGLPADMSEVKEIYRKIELYRRMLRLADCRLGEGKTFLRKMSKFILKPAAIMYGRQNYAGKIEEIAAKHSYEHCKYVGIVTNGLYGPAERMDKAEFEKETQVTFKGHTFPAFSCWDSYLRNLYGNYMELPPVDKRKTHDMIVYID